MMADALVMVIAASRTPRRAVRGQPAGCEIASLMLNRFDLPSRAMPNTLAPDQIGFVGQTKTVPRAFTRGTVVTCCWFGSGFDLSGVDSRAPGKYPAVTSV